MCDNDDKTMEGGGSVSECGPAMGNKHGSPKRITNNNHLNGEGGLESDPKYVSIVDVSFTSPHHNEGVSNGDVSSVKVNGGYHSGGETDRDVSVKVNGETSPKHEEASHLNGDFSVKVNGESSPKLTETSRLSNGDFSVRVNGETSPKHGEAFYMNMNGDFTVSVNGDSYMHVNGDTSSKHSQESLQIKEEKTIRDVPVRVNGDSCAHLNGETSEETKPHSGDGSSLVRVNGDGQESVDRTVIVVGGMTTTERQRHWSGNGDCWNQEEADDCGIVDFLDKSNDHAEARLAAKRQARAEAREIRMRELERLQRESEDNDRVYDVFSTPDGVAPRMPRAGSVTTPRTLLSSNNSYHSSRRSSEDSLEEVNSIRDVRMELKECEDKFRKAMVANAQLDNEKASLAFQVDLYKDKYEELEEQHHQLTREHKETCRQLDQTKRHRAKLQEDLDVSRAQLEELLQLIKEKGLVVVEGEEEEEEGEEGEGRAKPPRKALVSAEVADVLQHGTGSLDVRLRRFVEERNELLDELRRVKLELEEERASRGRHANGPTDDQDDIQREANKLLGDYKFKLQKAEQDVNTLQANVARLESQVVRYKSIAETSEKLEDELKSEKRKLQRELREAQARVEELETSHSHLQRRLDKLKNAKSALLKDL